MGAERAAPEPSLAGVAVTRGPKRRQGSCRMRKVSLEIGDVVEAETVMEVEGCMCAVARRDGDAPPGSRTHQVRKVVVGTREARPGPRVWSPVGVQCEGCP